MSHDAEFDSEVEEDVEELCNQICPHCHSYSPFAVVQPDGTVRCIYCGAGFF